MYSVCCWSSVLRILPVKIGSDDEGGGFIFYNSFSLEGMIDAVVASCAPWLMYQSECPCSGAKRCNTTQM